MEYSCDNLYEEMKNLHSWQYIDVLNYKVEEIENQYTKSHLSVMKKPRNEELEKRTKIRPSMVAYFYSYIKEKKEIPNQRQYIEYYWCENERWIMENLNKNKREGLFGRLCRFYPSMLRDFHFYHFLKESGNFEKVYFNLKADLEGKVDVFVKKDQVWYGLQLRTATRNSNYFYEKKKNRNPIQTKAILIDLPIDMGKAKVIKTKCDDLKLYGEEQLKQILKEIHKRNT